MPDARFPPLSIVPGTTSIPWPALRFAVLPLRELPAALPYWVAAVVVGGFIGATLGSRRLGNNAMRQALAAVLLIAGAKMVL